MPSSEPVEPTVDVEHISHKRPYRQANDKQHRVLALWHVSDESPQANCERNHTHGIEQGSLILRLDAFLEHCPNECANDYCAGVYDCSYHNGGKVSKLKHFCQKNCSQALCLPAAIMFFLIIAKWWTVRCRCPFATSAATLFCLRLNLCPFLP